MKFVSIDSLDLTNYIRAGDRIYYGEGSGEPVGLVNKLIAQRAELGGCEVFVGMSVSAALRPEHADHLRFFSYGAVASVSQLQRAGVLTLVPFNYSSLPDHITAKRLPVDVVFVQLSPPGPDGSYSLGMCNAAVTTAMRQARTVIAEINAQIPWSYTDTPVDPNLITVATHTDRLPPNLPSVQPSDTDRRIARHIAGLINDGATLQYGIGGIPSALLGELSGHRNLGLHTGLFTDGVIDLIEAGVITNARKSNLPGVSVAAFAIGGERLCKFMHNNAALRLCQLAQTHGAAALAQIDNLMAINSALEVDLFGQVNAEQVGDRYVGTIGGQVDFMHAASVSASGLSVIAMPSTIPKTGASRISAQLNGPVVTTARADVDVVITEHGIADLRGRSVQERAQLLIDIAAPEHRERLASNQPR